MVNVRTVTVLWTTLILGGWLIKYRLLVLNTQPGASLATQLIKEILPNDDYLLASGCVDENGEKVGKEYDECIRTWASGFREMRRDGYRDKFCGSVY